MKYHRLALPKIQKTYPLQWVFDSLEEQPGFTQKKMFGCQAAYLGKRLVLVTADKEEPWNGVLVPTDRVFHDSLIEQFPMLSPHAVLGKWLYLSQDNDNFESVVAKLLQLILDRDPRIGVAGSPKKAF